MKKVWKFGQKSEAPVAWIHLQILGWCWMMLDAFKYLSRISRRSKPRKWQVHESLAHIFALAFPQKTVRNLCGLKPSWKIIEDVAPCRSIIHQQFWCPRLNLLDDGIYSLLLALKRNSYHRFTGKPNMSKYLQITEQIWIVLDSWLLFLFSEWESMQRSGQNHLETRKVQTHWSIQYAHMCTT